VPSIVAFRATCSIQHEPNGDTRDFRSRLGSADSAQGKVDRQEGKITGSATTDVTPKPPPKAEASEPQCEE
jgi:hypothetical protein